MSETWWTKDGWALWAKWLVFNLMHLSMPGKLSSYKKQWRHLPKWEVQRVIKKIRAWAIGCVTTVTDNDEKSSTSCLMTCPTNIQSPTYLNVGAIRFPLSRFNHCPNHPFRLTSSNFQPPHPLECRRENAGWLWWSCSHFWIICRPR